MANLKTIGLMLFAGSNIFLSACASTMGVDESQNKIEANAEARAAVIQLDNGVAVNFDAADAAAFNCVRRQGMLAEMGDMEFDPFAAYLRCNERLGNERAAMTGDMMTVLNAKFKKQNKGYWNPQ